MRSLRLFFIFTSDMMILSDRHLCGDLKAVMHLKCSLWLIRAGSGQQLLPSNNSPAWIQRRTAVQWSNAVSQTCSRRTELWQIFGYLTEELKIHFKYQLVESSIRDHQGAPKVNKFKPWVCLPPFISISQEVKYQTCWTFYLFDLNLSSYTHSRITAPITCSTFVRKRLALTDLFRFCLSVFVLTFLWFGGGGAQLEEKKNVAVYLCAPIRRQLYYSQNVMRSFAFVTRPLSIKCDQTTPACLQ